MFNTKFKIAVYITIATFYMFFMISLIASCVESL